MQFKAHCKRLFHVRFRKNVRSVTKLVGIMKLIIFLVVAGCLQVSARTRAQTVTYTARAVPLAQVLLVIEQQTGYNIFYNESDIKGSTPVTAELQATPLREALERVLAGQPVGYDMRGNTIYLVRRPAETPATITARPTAIDLHGRVIDSLGQPLVGASVSLKDTRFSTLTDNRGDFRFRSVPLGKYRLVVTSIGYDRQVRAIAVGADTVTIHVVMHTATSDLDQAQVIAYGQTTERFNVGSINKVTSEQIEAQPVSNPLQALEGQVPGLIVTQSSGLAGASSTVQIRGQNTVTTSLGAGAFIGGFNQPLFVIDGVPFAPQNNSINQLGSLLTPTGGSANYNLTGNATTSSAGYSGLSPFSTIPPDMIESIEVLKDADATAIYGSRGANGVVLITTKRGKPGKTTLTAGVQSGFNQVGRTVAMMNEQQYLQMRHEAYNNDGIIPSLNTYAYDLALFDTTKNTNWKQQFLSGTAHYTTATLTLSGGTVKDKFRLGSTYNINNDIFPGNYGQNTMSVNAAFDHASQDNKFTMGFSSMYSYGRNNTPGSPSVAQAFQLPPDYPNLLDKQGNLVWSYNGYDLGNYSGNTLAYLKQSSLAQVYTLTSSLQLKYNILNGLSLSANLGYNTVTNNEYSTVPMASQDPAQNPVASASYSYSNSAEWYTNTSLNYYKVFGRNRLSAQAWMDLEQNSSTGSSESGFNYANDILLGSINNAGTIGNINGFSTLYKRVENVIRINDIYNDEFILGVSGNRDATSRFGPGRQFGNFYSVAGGWIFSEWDWLKNKIPGLSFGKIRVSYGLTGGDAIGDYQYQANYRAYQYSFQGVRGYLPANLANPDYGWDANHMLDGGLDLGFIKDRIVATVDYHLNRTGNQLTYYPLPWQTGFSNVIENEPLVVENKGLEFTLSTKNIQTRSFQWTTSFNIGTNRNILVSFPGLASSSYAYEYKIGQPLGIQPVLKFDGVNPQTGVLQYLSAKGTVAANPNQWTVSEGGDETQNVNPNPIFSGGIGNTLSYKHFSLSVFCQFTKQTGLAFLGQIYEDAIPGTGTNQPAFLLKQAWSTPGQQTNVEKFTEQYGSPAYTAAQYYISSTGAYTDASFLRVKTVSAAYHVPAAYLKRIGVTACNINFSAQNLFTLTRYTGDPETQNIFMIPPMKTVTLGINLTL